MTRVLVVDDCGVDRTLAGELLRRHTGFAVEYACDGEEALKKIAQSPPELVLTDLQMPGVNGLQLVSAVRQKYPRVPVILMTSQGSEEIAFRPLQVGAASYVPKSLLPDNLRNTVHKVLQAAIDESHYITTMSCLSRSERHFTLANDTTLFTPLIVHFQQDCAGLGDLRRVGADSAGSGAGRGAGQRHVSRQPRIESRRCGRPMPTLIITWPRTAAGNRPIANAASKWKSACRATRPYS